MEEYTTTLHKSKIPNKVAIDRVTRVQQVDSPRCTPESRTTDSTREHLHDGPYSSDSYIAEKIVRLVSKNYSIK